MNILALDLGSTTGWALGMGVSTYSGSEKFTPRKSEESAQRWLKFRAKLTEIASQAPEIHAVYFEEVHRHVGTDAAHVYGGFVALLQVWCTVNHIQCRGVGVGTVKKHWTGKGNAKKDEMIGQAQLRGFTVKDDNQADALAILSYAREKEGDRSAPLVRDTHAPAREIETVFDRETT